MFSSIRGRLWLSYAGLIAAALTIVMLVLTAFLLRNPRIYRETSIRIRAAQTLLARNANSDERVQLIAEALNVRALVVSPNGTILRDSAHGEPALNNPTLGSRPRRVDAVRDAAGQVWLYSPGRLADGNWLLVAARRPAILPVLDLLGDELWRPLMQGALIALALALILAYLLARWIAAPLQHLVEAAGAVSPKAESAAKIVPAGNAGVRGPAAMPQVPEEGPHEVRALIRAFNGMLARVQASQRSQKEFVANVSHELKTPLTSIQGFAQAIIDGTASTPEARRQAATTIRDEANRMHRMALGLLDLARLDAGTAELRMTSVDLSALLGGIVQEFQPAATAAGISLESSVSDHPLHVAGDPDRLAQIFGNLVDNAIKFTPRGGRVRVAGEYSGQEIRITVSDSGPGISKADIAQVFDRFYQADASRGGGATHGAGLGLAIAREWAEAHGGRITVRSALGHGAEFAVHLPPLEGGRVEHAAA